MEQAFTRIALPLQKRLPLTANPVSIAELPGGGFWLNFKDSPDVLKLNADLEPEWRKDLDAQSADYVSCRITASPGGAYMALAAVDSIRIANAAGEVLWTSLHRPWYHFQGGDCLFTDGDQMMWYITPGTREGDSDLLQVIRLPDFQVVATLEIPEEPECNYTFYPTPDPQILLFDLAAGQDECRLYQAQLRNGRIVVQELSAARDRIMGNFAPSGKEWVTAPHDEGAIVIFSFPAMEAELTITQESVFRNRDEYPSPEDADSLDYVVLYLNDSTLLAFTRFGRLLLIDRQSLRCFGELMPEGCTISAYDISGRPATNKESIVDYAGEIVELYLTKDGRRLLVTHNSGELRMYGLPGQFH